MEWTREQSLPPLDVTEDDRTNAEVRQYAMGCDFETRAEQDAVEALMCRERQLTAALSEIERLRSQLSKDDVQMGELAVGGMTEPVMNFLKLIASWDDQEVPRGVSAGFARAARNLMQPLPAPPSGEQAAAKVGNQEGASENGDQ